MVPGANDNQVLWSYGVPNAAIAEPTINAARNAKSQILVRHEAVPDFDIRGIFSDLTDDDYDRTMQLASGFRSDILRANVTITVARSVLDNKRVQTRKPQVTAK